MNSRNSSPFKYILSTILLLSFYGCSQTSLNQSRFSQRSPAAVLGKALVKKIQGKISIFKEDRLEEEYDSELIIRYSGINESEYVSHRSNNGDHNYFTMNVNIEGLPTDYRNHSNQKLFINSKWGLIFSINEFKKSSSSFIYNKITLEGDSKLNSFFQFITPDSVEQFQKEPRLIKLSIRKSTFFEGYFGGASSKYRLEFNAY